MLIKRHSRYPSWHTHAVTLPFVPCQLVLLTHSTPIIYIPIHSQWHLHKPLLAHPCTHITTESQSPHTYNGATPSCLSPLLVTDLHRNCSKTSDRPTYP